MLSTPHVVDYVIRVLPYGEGEQWNRYVYATHGLRLRLGRVKCLAPLAKKATTQEVEKATNKSTGIFHSIHDRGAFDSAKNHKRQRRKRQSVTAKREKSQTPKIV